MVPHSPISVTFMNSLRHRRDAFRRVILPGVAAAMIFVPTNVAHSENRNPIPAPPCEFEPIGIVTARSASDGRTFALSDGREVRLAGIEVPSPAAAGDRVPQSAAGQSAKAALEALIAGKTVTLSGSGPKTDRYGRLYAYAAVTKEGAQQSVQHVLIAQGYARVSARIGTAACGKELLALEQRARAAKLGLWREPYYELRQAANPGAVLADQGRFSIVEGKVVSVRESGATVYVNFGRRWSQDFTVTILKRNARKFVAAGLDPKVLGGRQVRVRGWVQARGGPLIEAVHPEQIEMTEARTVEPVN
jgi:endonuclease YncB( thermonuclease family)